MRNSLFLMLAVTSLFFTLPACDKVEEFFTYDLLITNETADDLEIFESKNGGTFHQIGGVSANATSREKGFLIDVNYRLEARTDNGTVTSTIDFRGDRKEDEIDWLIN